MNIVLRIFSPADRLFTWVEYRMTSERRHEERRPLLLACERARTIAGILVFVVIVGYDPGSVLDRANETFFLSAFIDLMVAVLALPFGIIVVVAAAPPGARRRVARTAMRPLANLGLVLLALTIWVAPALLVSRSPQEVARILGIFPEQGSGTALAAIFALIALVFVILIFEVRFFVRIIRLLKKSVHHWFGAAYAHPLLPAVSAAIFGVISAAWLTVRDIGPLHGLPGWTPYAVAFGSPATLIALSVLELALWRRDGVTLRSWPGRRPRAGERGLI